MLTYMEVSKHGDTHLTSFIKKNRFSVRYKPYKPSILRGIPHDYGNPLS